MGVFRDFPNFLEYPLLSQKRVKLRTSNLAGIYSEGLSEQKPLKIWEKKEREHIQGLSKIFEYPLLSQERVQLRTSNLAHVIRANKSPLIIWEKRVVWVYPGTSQLSQERVKLRTSNLAGIFIGTKAP